MNSMMKTYEAPLVRWTEYRPDQYFCVSLPGTLEETYDDIIED